MLRFENWFDQFWEVVNPIFRGFKTGLIIACWTTLQKELLLYLVLVLRFENWFDQFWNQIFKMAVEFRPHVF